MATMKRTWEDAIVDLACVREAREYCRTNGDSLTLGRGYMEDIPAEMREFLERFYTRRMPHRVVITSGEILLVWDGGNGATERFEF